MAILNWILRWFVVAIITKRNGESRVNDTNIGKPAKTSGIADDISLIPCVNAIFNKLVHNTTRSQSESRADKHDRDDRVRQTTSNSARLELSRVRRKCLRQTRSMRST